MALRTRLAYKLDSAFERRLPEQRLFLKSAKGTRFIRLRPTAMAAALAGATALFAWTIVLTAIFLMDAISADNQREQSAKERAIYEARLNALSKERDDRANEAKAAQLRFAKALEQISTMQSSLLALEDSRTELQTGLDVVHSTLRRTIKERDAARVEGQQLLTKLQEDIETQSPQLAKASAMNGSVEFLTDALAKTAAEREAIAKAAEESIKEAEDLRLTLEINEERNERIFQKLEEAVSVSLEPLDKMFRAAGLPTDSIIEQVRRGYSGQGGPLRPLTTSTSNAPEEFDPATDRANLILRELDRINIFRIAAEQAPLATPVKSAFRFTSGFGPRRDPKVGGTRMHNGVDFASRTGTPIYSTAEGVVTHAGWQSGYGRLVKIRHAFGVETRYAHLSRIRVTVGEKVSRGERIGDMGASGRVTGTHLHYEVRVNGKAVNPMTYIKAGRDVF